MTTHDHAPNVKRYLMVFAALLCLTVITVGVSYLKLPIHLAVALGVFIATIKASLVALFFMHLSNERALIYWFLGVTAVCAVILFAIPISHNALIETRIQAVEGAGHGGSAHGDSYDSEEESEDEEDEDDEEDEE